MHIVQLAQLINCHIMLESEISAVIKASEASRSVQVYTVLYMYNEIY